MYKKLMELKNKHVHLAVRLPGGDLYYETANTLHVQPIEEHAEYSAHPNYFAVDAVSSAGEVCAVAIFHAESVREIKTIEGNPYPTIFI